MTDEQYKALQAWCQKSSNKRDPEYGYKVALRNKATQLKQQIRGYKIAIQDACMWLDQSKDDLMINKWTASINASREQKAFLQKQFNTL